MPDNELDRPFVVTYELNELVVNMCALVMYHSKKINELAELGSSCSDQRAKDISKRYVCIAESLILRLQDVLDEKELSSLAATQDDFDYA